MVGAPSPEYAFFGTILPWAAVHGPALPEIFEHTALVAMFEANAEPEEDAKLSGAPIACFCLHGKIFELFTGA